MKTPEASSPPTPEEAEAHFLEGLIDRGEAVTSTGGDLPPGATHEIVEDPETGAAALRRLRFSIS